jgi:pilus assembly protein CpaD
MYKPMPTSTAARIKVAFALLTVSFLAGCSTDQLAADDQYVSTAHYEQYPINVAKAPIKVDISSKQGTLQPSQVNAITELARSALNASVTKISVKRPSSGGASNRVARETYLLLIKSGISARMIVQGTYPGPAKAPVQISFVRSVAVTKECGDWSSDLADTSANGAQSNFGCSVQNNLAAMTANPEDFVVPRATTPVFASSRN